MTFNDLCPEPLRIGKSLGQVKDLASKEHAYLRDELLISDRMEVCQLSEHAGASVLKLCGDDGRKDNYRRKKDLISWYVDFEALQ